MKTALVVMLSALNVGQSAFAHYDLAKTPGKKHEKADSLLGGIPLSDTPVKGSSPLKVR